MVKNLFIFIIINKLQLINMNSCLCVEKGILCRDHIKTTVSKFLLLKFCIRLCCKKMQDKEKYVVKNDFFYLSFFLF